MTKDILPSPFFSSEEELLQCVVFMSGLLKNPLTVESIKNGMPVPPSGIMPIDMLIKSLERHHFEATISDRPFEQLALFQPCIMILRGKRQCVLLKTSNGHATVYFPGLDQPTIIPLSDLKELYIGKAILILHQALHVLQPKEEGSARWFWNVIKLYKHEYAQMIHGSFWINTLLLVSTIYSMTIYDKVIGNKASDTLLVLSAGVAIAYIADFIIRIGRGHLVDDVGRSADNVLGDFLYKRILSLKLMYRPPSSGGLAHYLREFDNIRDFFSATTIISVIDIPFTLIFLFAIWLISPIMVCVPLMGMLGIILLNWVMRPAFKQSAKNLLNNLEFKHGILMECLQNFESVKALNAQGHMLYKWEQALNATSHAAEQAHQKTNLLTNLGLLFQNFCYMGLIMLGSYQIFDTNLSIGGLIAITILTTRSVSSIGALSAVILRAQQARTSLKMLDAIVNLPTEQSPDIQYIPRPQIKGDIEFVDVDFNYPDQEYSALKEVSFKISAGERVAIIGTMGSGKSTLAKLILGLYQPTSGLVMIDGIDVKQSDISDIRASIGYVSQYVDLFRGTLRDNILLPKPSAGDQKMLEVSEMSGVHDFVRVHPKGFDMQITEGGGGLSGGQRQAVGIARALIRDPQILLLDEATSNIDKKLESKIIGNLLEYAVNKTVIMITHEIELADLVDRIIVLDQGKIIYNGHPSEMNYELSS